MGWAVSELICIKCYKRWIGVRPEQALLKEIECPQCKEQGFVIETGQLMEEESICNLCKINKDGKCKLNIEDKDNCGYFEEK